MILETKLIKSYPYIESNSFLPYEIQYFFKDSNRNETWYLGKKLHREDGPAIEYANGDKVWYVNGKKVKPNL